MRLLKVDRRLRALFDLISGGVLTAFGVDLIRIAGDSNVTSILAEILKVFDVSMTLGLTQNGNTAYMVVGGIVFGLIGLTQLYDGFRRITK